MGKIEENKGAKTIVFYEAKLPLKKKRAKNSQKEGRVFSKNDAPLQRKGPFGNLEKFKKNLEKFKKKQKNGTKTNLFRPFWSLLPPNPPPPSRLP